MCFPTGGASFKVKISIGSGPSFAICVAICVFSVILTFQSNARAVSARVSRFFTIGSSLLLKVRSSPSSVLKAVLFLSIRVRLVVHGRR
jgi:hypothetical protein